MRSNHCASVISSAYPLCSLLVLANASSARQPSDLSTCAYRVIHQYMLYHDIFDSVGRGMKSGENFEMLYNLAQKMNAAGNC